MIPHSNTFACGTAVSRKCNTEGNIIGSAHDNPILDSWVYDVEFANGKVTALMANAIVTAMYTQCNPDGNEYTPLDNLINFRRTDAALTLDQQQITFNGTTHQCKTTWVGPFVADEKTVRPERVPSSQDC